MSPALGNLTVTSSREEEGDAPKGRRVSQDLTAARPGSPPPPPVRRHGWPVRRLITPSSHRQSLLSFLQTVFACDALWTLSMSEGWASTLRARAARQRALFEQDRC